MKERIRGYGYHDITPWIIICYHFKILQHEQKSRKMYPKEGLALVVLRSKTDQVSLVSVADRIWFQNWHRAINRTKGFSGQDYFLRFKPFNNQYKASQAAM